MNRVAHRTCKISNQVAPSKFHLPTSQSEVPLWGEWWKILHSMLLHTPKLKVQNAYFFTSKNLKDPIVIVNCRTAIKTLPLYLNLCLSVMLDILSCSFKSISFLTNWSKTGSSAIIFKFKNSTKIFDKLPNTILHNDHSIHYHP